MEIDIFDRDGAALRVPASASSLAGFRAWAHSDQFPERGCICFINGEIFIDMSPEELQTHNKVKGAVHHVVDRLNNELELGEFFPDGALLSNRAAHLSTVPDGTLVKWPSYELSKVRLIPRKDEEGQYIELQGSPDWVLEVVSRSSFVKDTRQLRAAYHRAGIAEYWLIDAQGKEIDFKILVRGRSGYRAVPARQGWHRSRVFGRQFRLERRRNRLGRWQYKLHVKPV